jgi:hypothetical protein
MRACFPRASRGAPHSRPSGRRCLQQAPAGQTRISSRSRKRTQRWESGMTLPASSPLTGGMRKAPAPGPPLVRRSAASSSFKELSKVSRFFFAISFDQTPCFLLRGIRRAWCQSNARPLLAPRRRVALSAICILAEMSGHFAWKAASESTPNSPATCLRQRAQLAR